MDLSSTLSDTKEFRIVKRGYDPDEVDIFLDQIAVGVAELKRKLAEAANRAQSSGPGVAPAPDDQADEVHRMLVMAQRVADEEVRQAHEDAQRLVAEARAEADALRTEVQQDVAGRREEGERLVAETRSQADALRAEVERDVAARREEGQRLLGEAQSRVAALRADVDRDLAVRRDEGRAALVAEISELEAVRDAFANDLVVLERHVEEQREVVQAAVGELQSLLDHPEAFRIAPASGMSGASAPEPGPSRDQAPIDARTEGPPTEATPPAAAAASAEEVPGPIGTMLDIAEDEAPVEASSAAGPSPAEVSEPDLAPAPVDLTDEGGPPTEAIDIDIDIDEAEAGEEGVAHDEAPSDSDPDEDAFLAELRKAMLDDEPLGPRDTPAPPPSGDMDDDPSRGDKPRFGRRR